MGVQDVAQKWYNAEREWDPTFVENVKRDGIILYQRVPLPAAFTA
jgi:hypothetical protein